MFNVINRYWHASIQRQLVLGIALVHAILMTIFIFDLTERERDFLQRQSLKQAIALTEVLAANSISWVLANDVVGLGEIVSYQTRYPGLEYAMVISTRGRILGHTDNQLIGNYLSDARSQQLISSDAITRVLWHDELRLDVAAPIISANKLIGWARVGISTHEVEANLQTVTRDGLLYTVLAIVVGIIFAIIMARGLTASINNLLDVTDKVRQGERQIRANEQRHDEIGKLGKAFNAMIIAVEKSDQALIIAKEAAEENNRAKSQFIANMSHELRTPLNAVIGYSDMLQDELSELEQEEIADDLSKINAAGRHLLGLINDVLDLSKIESGKMEIFNETFDVQKMLKDVLITVQILMQQRNNQLTVSCENTVGLMYSDVTKIRQILLNLLSNASKFTEHGYIKLDVRLTQIKQSSWISFAITDTGIGISKQQQEKLFKAFSQVDASTTRKYGGTGLGLLITKHFTEMLGGYVSVESELGQGSTFTVHFPIKTASREIIPELENRLIGTYGSLKTVLVIDDDDNIRQLLSKYIQKLGYKVITAKSGSEGLKLALKFKPHLITLDVMMPEMDGWMVLSELKTHPNLKDIPVIMLSMLENQALGYSLGAADYLIKPVDQQQIAQVLAKYSAVQYKQVLVVEDDIMIRDMLRQMLRKQEWQILTANNGQAALNLIEAQLPDVILLDLMMPEMDGFEFISRLRHNEKWRDIPVIVLTAKDITLDDRHQLSAEVDAIFQKGAYDREELLATLRRALQEVI